MSSLMNILRTLTVSAALVALAATMPAMNAQGTQAPAPPPKQAKHPSGKLVIWGDLALFTPPTAPDNCILTNRFKKGQKVGFRMTAFDGGTGETENSAILVAHLTYGGKKIDVPMRWRGAAGPNGTGSAGVSTFAGRTLDRGLDRAGRRAKRRGHLYGHRRRTDSAEPRRSRHFRRKHRSSSSSSSRTAGRPARRRRIPSRPSDTASPRRCR